MQVGDHKATRPHRTCMQGACFFLTGVGTYQVPPRSLPASKMTALSPRSRRVLSMKMPAIDVSVCMIPAQSRRES